MMKYWKCQKKTKKRLEKQDKIIQEQGERIEGLNFIVNKMEQKELNKKIILRGLPEVNSDDLKTKVLEAISVIDPDIKQEDILNVSEMGKERRNNTKPVIIEFATPDLQKNVLRKKRGFMKEAATRMMFVHEMITTENYKLFVRARELKKNYNYKHVYTVEGRILVRKEDTGSVIWIKNHKQLDDIIYQMTQTQPNINTM